MNRKRGQRENTCHLIREIPRDLWENFNARRHADSAKLGRDLLMDEVLIDLIRQYASAVTWLGNQHIR